MKSLFRRPLIWFVAQAMGFAVWLWATGKFQPVIAPDTNSYAAFSFNSVAAAFNQIRTIGYPVFLQFTSLLTDSHTAVPCCQYAVHVMCVLVFWLGTRSLFSSSWVSMAVASSLLYSNVIFRYVFQVTADSLASSLSILTLGLLLILNTKRPKIGLWAAFSLAVFATYQVRPAFLFLLPVLPFCGAIMKWMLHHPADKPSGARRHLIRLGVCTTLPFLLFCSLRMVVSDHFAIVSFGGSNLAGTFGQFMTPDMISDLPEELHPLAHAIEDHRQHVAEKHPWFQSRVTLDYMDIERRFDLSTWHVFIPAAETVYGPDPRKTNAGLRKLAFEVIKAKPGYYALWLGKAFWRGSYMVVSEIMANPVYLLLIALAIFTQMRYVFHHLKTAAIAPENARADLFIGGNIMLGVGVVIAITKISLVILTSPPIGRFMDPAGVFLAPAVVVFIADRWHRGSSCSRLAER